MTCGLCEQPIEKGRDSLLINGKVFCSDEHEEKYQAIFDEWLRTARERKHE